MPTETARSFGAEPEMSSGWGSQRERSAPPRTGETLPDLPPAPKILSSHVHDGFTFPEDDPYKPKTAVNTFG